MAELEAMHGPCLAVWMGPSFLRLLDILDKVPGKQLNILYMQGAKYDQKHWLARK